jgi:hypothetical protein
MHVYRAYRPTSIQDIVDLQSRDNAPKLPNFRGVRDQGKNLKRVRESEKVENRCHML